MRQRIKPCPTVSGNDTTTMSNTTTQNATETATASKMPDFGNGRYSPLMLEAYRDALRLTKMSPSEAEAFARLLGADLGRAFSAAPSKVTYGKANSHGRLTMKEAAGLKGIVATRPISIARLLSLANDLSKEAQALGGVSVTFNVDSAKPVEA